MCSISFFIIIFHNNKHCIFPIISEQKNRMLNNKNIGTHICNINLNQHSHGHLYRSSLEGIAFSFMYGMEILKNDNALINVVRAGNDNLFRSKIFANTVATLIGHEIEIYNTTGAFGAARASGVMNDNLDSFRKINDLLSKGDVLLSNSINLCSWLAIEFI